MQDVFSSLAIGIPILLVLIGAVVVYLVLMVRAIIDMLRYDVHGVLLTFAFLALIPFPPILVMGITVLIMGPVLENVATGIDMGAPVGQ